MKNPASPDASSPRRAPLGQHEPIAGRLGAFAQQAVHCLSRPAFEPQLDMGVDVPGDADAGLAQDLLDALMSSLSASSSEPHECRSSWKVTRGSAVRARMAARSRLALRGPMGGPNCVVKTTS